MRTTRGAVVVSRAMGGEGQRGEETGARGMMGAKGVKGAKGGGSGLSEEAAATLVQSRVRGWLARVRFAVTLRYEQCIRRISLTPHVQFHFNARIIWSPNRSTFTIPVYTH